MTTAPAAVIPPAPTRTGATSRVSLPSEASSSTIVRILLSVSELKELRVLKLGHSNISGEGLRALSTLSQVEKLGLEGCARVNDEAMKELAAWKSLKYLDVQETKVTPAGVASLQAAKPGIQILSGPVSAT